MVAVAEREVAALVEVEVGQAATADEVAALSILRRGREVLDEFRWGKGHYQWSTGHVCALGALGIASGSPLHAAFYQSSASDEGAAGVALTALSEQAVGPLRVPPFTPTPGCDSRRVGVVAWNDHPERTEADVVAAFDRAIAKLAERVA